MARQNKDINRDISRLVRQFQALIPLLADLQQAGIADSDNSTDETLGAGGSFTGEWKLVGDRVQAAITIAVTAASAADGLVFEHSTDGVTVMHSHAYAIGAGESRHFDEPLLMDFFRVRYTDGGAGGDLDLQVKLFNTPPTAHAHALSDAFNAEHPANIVRSILAGFDAVGGLSKNVNTYATSGGQNALLGLLIDQASALLRFYTEDAAKTGNTVGIAPMAVRDDVLSALTPADGDWAPFRLDANGALWVVGTISGGVAADTELPPAAALGDNTANPTAPAVGSFLHVWDGATWDRLPGTSAGGALIQSLQLPAALAAGGGLKIEGVAGGVSVPVTASAGTNLNTSLLSLEATQVAMSAKLPATLGQKAMTASLAVVLASDQSPIPVTGAGGGTEYTEDAVAAADPVGGAQILVADSTPALEVADGDNVARRGTRYGAAYAQIVTSAGAFVDSFGGSPTITEATIPAGFDVLGTAASSTYATALASAAWRWLKIVNTTDQDFAISFDAATQHKRIASGLTEFIDLYSNGLKITAAVSYKYLTLPTRGRFQVEGLSA